MEELRADPVAGAALESIEKLRELRSLILSGQQASGGEGDDVYAEVLMQAGHGEDGRQQEAMVGLFRGYSRELLRIRQQLTKAAVEAEADPATSKAARAANVASAGIARAQMMLTALAQRARADAAVLEPPPLLPGITSTASAMLDPLQGKYAWLCERPQRMEALCAALAAVESAAYEALPAEVGGEETASALRSDAIAMVVSDEKGERMCEGDRWDRLLATWAREKARGSEAGLDRSGRGHPDEHPHAQPHHLHQPRSPPAQSSRHSLERGVSRLAEELADGLSVRLPFLRSGAELPWVDDLAKEYGLEYAARNRAVGVAREMAAAGYTAVQTRSVLLGMLHGTQARLLEAWRVFVPGGERDLLSRAEWKLVLGMLSGGLGMSAEETDQLFTVFDADGSGTLDFGEFQSVLDALPLQRTVAESAIGSAISAMQSMLVLRRQLLQRLSIDQLAAAGRIITRLRDAGFSTDEASCVVHAIYLSRSRAALRDAWDVLCSATEVVPGGRRGSVSFSSGAGSMDLAQFARLLPLLGDDLPLSRVERLFEQVDVDKSGQLDFDEFVQMIRKLKPKGRARNSADACRSAFDSFTSVRSGPPKALRRAVPGYRRTQAGSLLLTLRDLGYDDKQVVTVLSAIYASPSQTDGAASASTSTSSAARSGRAAPSGGGANRLAPIRSAWESLGGGELVRLPANPFDFGKRDGDSFAHAREETVAIAQLADRWQCASGVDAMMMQDLLALFAESLSMEHGWPTEVSLPITECLEGGQKELSFSRFARIVCEMRATLEAMSEAESSDVGGAEGSTLSAPLLALQSAKPVSMSDESFANPLQRLAQGGTRRRGNVVDLRESAADCLCGMDVDDALNAAVRLGDRIQEAVQGALVQPVSDALSENVDPLRFVLSRKVRMQIPEWQAQHIGRAVKALRRNGFRSREINVLVRALYAAREGDEAGSDAALRAWRVLRHHSARFVSVESASEDGAGSTVLGRAASTTDASVTSASFKGPSFRAGGSFREGTSFRDGASFRVGASFDDSFRSASSFRREEGPPPEEDPRFDMLTLDADACRRMLWLLCSPLMKEPQLEALFLAFDTNRDGAISKAELERLLRLLDPHRRLAKLKPLDIPKEVTPMMKAMNAIAEAAGPSLAKANALWTQLDPFGMAKKEKDDGEDDDDEL